MSAIGEMKIFAGSSGRRLAEKMCSYMGMEISQSEVITFSEGNIYVKACEAVRGCDIYLVQPIGLKPNDELVEILFWADAFKRASAASVTAIIPYFSYAKADKKDEPRVSIRARVCADCMEVSGVDRVVTVDLHSPQIQGFFRKPVDNLYAMPVLCEYIKTLDMKELVVVSPDAGFAKTARKYAHYLKAELALGDKIRRGHDEKAEIINVIGDVKGKTALIADDFSLTGGTLVRMAEALKARGASHVYAAVTHMLFDDKAIRSIEESAIDKLVGMDTVVNPCIGCCSKIKTLSVAPLLAETVLRIQNRESISVLFEDVTENIIKQSW